jgi:hypothetical protein
MKYIALLLSLIATPSFAQTACAPYAFIVENLANLYGERVQTTALTSEGVVISFYANDKTGTWSLTITQPNGIACLALSGSAYEQTNTPSGDDA